MAVVCVQYAARWIVGLLVLNVLGDDESEVLRSRWMLYLMIPPALTCPGVARLVGGDMCVKFSAVCEKCPLNSTLSFQVRSGYDVVLLIGCATNPLDNNVGGEPIAPVTRRYFNPRVLLRHIRNRVGCPSLSFTSVKEAFTCMW